MTVSRTALPLSTNIHTHIQIYMNDDMDCELSPNNNNNNINNNKEYSEWQNIHVKRMASCFCHDGNGKWMKFWHSSSINNVESYGKAFYMIECILGEWWSFSGRGTLRKNAVWQSDAYNLVATLLFCSKTRRVVFPFLLRFSSSLPSCPCLDAIIERLDIFTKFYRRVVYFHCY